MINESRRLNRPVPERPEPTVLDLAIERTLLAPDRTHLAWIRTVLALTGGRHHPHLAS